MKEVSGIIISVLGLWLTSIGVLGETRVKELEFFITKWTYSRDTFIWRSTFKLAKSLQPFLIEHNDSLNRLLNLPSDIPYRKIFNYSFILTPIFSLILIFLPKFSSFLFARYNIFMLTAAILGLTVIVPVFILMIVWQITMFILAFTILPLIGFRQVSRFIFSVIWIFILPYSILNRFLRANKIESTLVIIGLILGTLGIILLV